MHVAFIVAFLSYRLYAKIQQTKSQKPSTLWYWRRENTKLVRQTFRHRSVFRDINLYYLYKAKGFPGRYVANLDELKFPADSRFVRNLGPSVKR